MNLKNQNVLALVLILFTNALNWAREDFLPWRWIVPTVLLLLFLWIALQEEDTLQAKVKTIQAVVLKPKKRKEFLRALLRVAERAALIGVVVFFAWSTLARWRIEYVASRLSWRASEFWKCRCLGMKTVGITGVTAKNILQYAPNFTKLSDEARLDTTRQAIIELQQWGIIRRDVPPGVHKLGITTQGTVVLTTQDTVVTNFGQKLCPYYLNSYKLPQPVPETPKTK